MAERARETRRSDAGQRIAALAGGALRLLVAAACLFPLAFLARLSTAASWPLDRVFPAGWRVDRWLAALGAGEGPGGELGHSLVLSVLLSLVVATISTGAGFITSRTIAYSRHRRALLFLAYVPFAFSPVILATCLLFLFIRLGLAGTALGVVLAQVTFSYGFAVVFFLGFWTPRQKAYEELVYTLGGSEWDAYRRALLPLARELLAVGFFQAFLVSWFQYGLTLLVGSGKVQTLPLKVFDYVREANPFNAALASCLLVLPPLALLAVNRRFVTRFEVRS